ncbi:hypothetical protein KH5H1_47200 [Corallococcus caeni]|uniref:DNA 3'-5' helicase II n=1 Tax=Corallococcus caeni TaxID=3082388 RepID=A0ABQ6QNP5_9BACT|nr:hypothetical protein KH5H1_47200 [Corallococcus sp. KH5-1]GMU04933.1 hypothetical protein ASNO1_11850 [Corallococcus sp. NO1]
MEFFQTTEATTGEARVFNALREAFRQDEGLCFLRYPFFETRGRFRHEPDILMLHRDLGLLIIEVKDLQARHVSRMEGHTWHMADWHKGIEEPYAQAEAQMWSALKRFNSVPLLHDRLKHHALVALPNVPRAEWAAKGFTLLPCNPAILHKDELGPVTLRRRLGDFAGTAGRSRLTNEEWQKARAVLGFGTVIEQIQKRGGFAGTAARVAASETRIAALDLEQVSIGVEIPPGPQRIRGIAGSGKTMLLAIKAARMHLAHPDWDIAFTFNTKSLYQVIQSYITELCRYLGDSEPNWRKLRVMHAWGGRTTGPGLYYVTAQAMGRKARIPNDFVRSTVAEKLAVACRELLEPGRVPELFDAVLVDEGQDLLSDFYRLAYAVLKAPKRLIWAYDEAQSLDHLTIPTSENLFGRGPDGKLLVDVAGQYPGGIYKSHIMRRCYRTPRQILLAAHAVGMGLLRPEGPVQAITTKSGWQDIGYSVETGGFASPGAEVVLVRSMANSGHPLDSLPMPRRPLLRSQGFADREAEFEACARCVQEQVRTGVRAEQIMVVHLGFKDELQRLAGRLSEAGVVVHSTEENPREFRRAGAVTVTGVHRAKGNESRVVFVTGLDCVERVEGEVVNRNHLFVALTRSRQECIVSGVSTRSRRLLHELETLHRMGDRIVFLAPDPKRLKRSLEDEPSPGVPSDPPRPQESPVRASVADDERFRTHLPLYDVRAAAGPWGAGRVVEQEVDGWVDATAIGALSTDMFAVRVAGKSMEPQIADGSIAVFRHLRDSVPEGKIVLVQQLQADHESVAVVVKRLARSVSGYRLESLNPLYSPLAFDPFSEKEPVRLLGVYLGVVPPARS